MYLPGVKRESQWRKSECHVADYFCYCCVRNLCCQRASAVSFLSQMWKTLNNNNNIYIKSVTLISKHGA